MTEGVVDKALRSKFVVQEDFYGEPSATKALEAYNMGLQERSVLSNSPKTQTPPEW